MNRINRSWVDVNRLGSPVTNSMIEVVAASSLDRVIAERDALQQRLTAADERIDELTKPQGEQMACMPVDRSYDVRAKMIIAFNEAKKTGGDLDDALDAAYKSALRYSPCPPTAGQPKPAATTIDYGSLDAVQRLALCRGDVSPVSAAPAEPDRIKGMIETVGGEYAVMIDQANGHYGWTFKKHPDGQWVSGRLATEAEMNAARVHAQITNQQ